jgi:hypothetical protein
MQACSFLVETTLPSALPLPLPSGVFSPPVESTNTLAFRGAALLIPDMLPRRSHGFPALASADIRLVTVPLGEQQHAGRTSCQGSGDLQIAQTFFKKAYISLTWMPKNEKTTPIRSLSL